jgi:hypothetical protein
MNTGPYSSRMNDAWKKEADRLRLKCRALQADLGASLLRLDEAREEAERLRDYCATDTTFPWDDET